MVSSTCQSLEDNLIKRQVKKSHLKSKKAKAKAKARSLLPNENDGRCQRGTVCRQRKVKEQMMKCVTCQENQNMSSKGGMLLSEKLYRLKLWI
eukprot:symbB.v1.2.007056.t1/scaffold414.1/size398445/20